MLIDGVSNPRDKAILSLLLHSGLRLSELCSLNRDSIKIQRLNSESGKVVGVGRVIGKGRKERDFLVNLSALKLIHTYLESRSDESTPLFLSNRNQRINQRSVQHLLRAWCKRLNLPPLHPHQLRSTFATRMHKVGVPTLEISHLLGHSSLDTTLFYLQPDSSRARMEFFAAHEKLAG